jgi:anaerobic magnesium-protoporphyrin IX monomethyl ester cyclase
LRVLVLRAPEVPIYFNAGHHLPVFMASAYLRRQPEVAAVDAVDAAALNITWRELCDRLWDGAYDVIAYMNDLGEVPALTELIAWVRALCPAARLITFGRLSVQVPGFFEKYDLDGIVCGGDYEAGLLTFIRWLGDPARSRPGVAVRSDGRWLPPSGPGLMLPVGEWALPDIDEIPYEAYDRLYMRDRSQYCGLPERRELVIPVARGCPIRCDFCEVWRREGLKERRLPVEQVVRYIRESYERARFDYVAMYAPTFTLRRRWVLDLCDALIDLGGIAWKCTTTLDHLDEELLTRMAQSGCTRVSVGIETLEPAAQSLLPTTKHCETERFDAMAELCTRLGVELNCFVILGLPGSTVAGTLATASHLRAQGARVRPTFYAAYHEMRPDMDERQIAGYNRQLAPGHLSGAEMASLYGLVHAGSPG